MTRALIALAVVWAVSLVVLAWCWREDRRRERRRRAFDEHAAQALATVAVEPCEAVVDRAPRRLPDPDRCPHLKPGATAFASRVAGEPMQVCSECWTTASAASIRINGLMQAGVPQGWGRS